MRDKKDKVVIALLEEMGYHDPVRVCSTCVHYKEADCGGGLATASQHYPDLKDVGIELLRMVQKLETA